MRGLAATLLFALPVAGLLAGAGAYVQLPGGNFRTALKYEDVKGATRIAPFALMRRPVTNAEFLAFVEQHPQWRRDRVAGVFAEARYLSHWPGPAKLGGKALPDSRWCRSAGSRRRLLRSAGRAPADLAGVGIRGGRRRDTARCTQGSGMA